MSYWKTKEAREYVEHALIYVRGNVDASREASLAITKLEEADMWLRQIQDRQNEAEFGEND